MMSEPLILMATDFSPHAQRALARAASVATQRAGSLHVIHVLKPRFLEQLQQWLTPSLASLDALAQADAHEQLRQCCEAYSKPGAPALHTQVLAGKPSQVIAEHAQAIGASLLVVGAGHTSSTEQALLGSTALRILQSKLACPVLVVRGDGQKRYRNVIVAVDLSEQSQSVIAHAVACCPGADLVLLHALELPQLGLMVRGGISQDQIASTVRSEIDRRRARLHESAAQLGLPESSYIVRVLNLDAPQALRQMQREYSADLIVVGKHGQSVVTDYLLGSASLSALTQPGVDVLLVPH